MRKRKKKKKCGTGCVCSPDYNKIQKINIFIYLNVELAMCVLPMIAVSSAFFFYLVYGRSTAVHVALPGDGSSSLGSLLFLYVQFFNKLPTSPRELSSTPTMWIIIIIINDTLARSLEPVVTECKEHTIHTQTQIVASRKPKEIKHTHEGEANFT